MARGIIDVIKDWKNKKQKEKILKEINSSESDVKNKSQKIR
ncbi:hypothetical protein [Campylobacter fetus]|nr:hypothetical protein [Campylobacter fetus]